MGGILLMTIGFSVLIIGSRQFWLIPFVIWFIGWLGTYIFIAGKEMKRLGIKRMKKATLEHQLASEKLFAYCALCWWCYWIDKKNPM